MPEAGGRGKSLRMQKNVRQNHENTGGKEKMMSGKGGWRWRKRMEIVEKLVSALFWEKGHSQSLPKKQGQLYNKHQSGGTG